MRTNLITEPFRGGRDNNCPCYAWKIMLRRLYRLRRELVEVQRENERLRGLLGGGL